MKSSEKNRVGKNKKSEKNRAGKSRKIEGSGDRESRVRQSRFLIFLYVSNRQKVC